MDEFDALGIEAIIEALRSHINLLASIVEMLLEFNEKHGDVIAILSDIRGLERYVSRLDDKDASLLSRAILIYNTIVLDLASMSARPEPAALAELRDRLEEASRRPSELLSQRGRTSR